MDPDGRSLLKKLFSKPAQKTTEQTEKEIRMLIDGDNGNGKIEKTQKDMINNIFDFDDITVAEVMTHRTDIVAVELEDNIFDVVKTVIEEGFSRIPVYKDDLDHIVGVIFAKDLLRLIGNTNNLSVSDFIRNTIFIPTSNRCRELFDIFLSQKIHLAVVVDEYGGTAGIVTMEDLIESIVGSIQDEYDDEEDEIFELDESTFVIEGSADIQDVANALNIEIPQNDDYDTLAGFVTDLLGRIPTADEHPSVEYGGIRFTVMVLEDRRIIKVKAEINFDQEQKQVGE